MAMMSDLTRGGPAGEIPGFAPNMAPPNLGPGKVESDIHKSYHLLDSSIVDLGFMMFVDDNQMMGGPAGFPSRPAQRF